MRYRAVGGSELGVGGVRAGCQRVFYVYRDEDV